MEIREGRGLKKDGLCDVDQGKAAGGAGSTLGAPGSRCKLAAYPAFELFRRDLRGAKRDGLRRRLTFGCTEHGRDESFSGRKVGLLKRRSRPETFIIPIQCLREICGGEGPIPEPLAGERRGRRSPVLQGQGSDGGRIALRQRCSISSRRQARPGGSRPRAVPGAPETAAAKRLGTRRTAVRAGSREQGAGSPAWAGSRERGAGSRKVRAPRSPLPAPSFPCLASAGRYGLACVRRRRTVCRPRRRAIPRRSCPPPDPAEASRADRPRRLRPSFRRPKAKPGPREAKSGEHGAGSGEHGKGRERGATQMVPCHPEGAR